jgi:carbonic anhydrase
VQLLLVDYCIIRRSVCASGGAHTPPLCFPFETISGCADARVPANEIMGEDAGSVFVVRNVANLVVATDVNLMAALQYAVTVLEVPHIIVCGHYDCGGVRASMAKKDHLPPLENWLRNIRDV